MRHQNCTRKPCSDPHYNRLGQNSDADATNRERPGARGGPKVRILIVEDSPLIRTMYGLAISKREHELVLANDGREALDLLAKGPEVHLILLDLRMPDMNGVEFLRELRKSPTLADTKVIITTAEPSTSDMVLDAKALGVAAVVFKPWKPQDLKKTVDQFLHSAA